MPKRFVHLTPKSVKLISLVLTSTKTAS